MDLRIYNDNPFCLSKLQDRTADNYIGSSIKKHIGAVSIHSENGIGELGWIVNEKYWENGFAYEAAEALVTYFIDNMETTHFIAHCDTENAASYKVMEKLGMVRTGKWGGRRNKSASHDTFEYQYELIIPR